MKTTLFLNDESTRATELLQDALPANVPLPENEAVAGCNCDRWGHPCRRCMELVVQPKPNVSEK